MSGSAGAKLQRELYRIANDVAAVNAGLEATCEELSTVLENAEKCVDKMLVTLYATPNERRMMHNKRKRIRKKYYNRVKRRIWG